MWDSEGEVRLFLDTRRRPSREWIDVTTSLPQVEVGELAAHVVVALQDLLHTARLGRCVDDIVAADKDGELVRIPAVDNVALVDLRRLLQLLQWGVSRQGDPGRRICCLDQAKAVELVRPIRMECEPLANLALDVGQHLGAVVELTGGERFFLDMMTELLVHELQDSVVGFSLVHGSGSSSGSGGYSNGNNCKDEDQGEHKK